MSSFSGNVSRVANTRIFARVSQNGTQFLVYQMEYSAANDVALILPLPTPPDTAPDQVHFVRLSNYENFFSDMENGFPYTRNAPVAGSHAQHVMTHLVGSFESFFVPTPHELDKLDERFRVPSELVKRLPEYNDFGFAVFKLRAGENTVQPLAIEFPTRNPQLVFFPTTQIRDGKVPEEAPFDYDLFCQARAGWLRSYDVASSFMNIAETHGVVDPGERISRMTVQGLHPNSDILVGLRA